jgi:DNA-binding SARP family transcriptional activator
MVEFCILGPLRLAVGGGDLDIGGAKRRGLVARLLVDANHVVPVERIVDGLWPDATPDEAKAKTKTVQTYVSQLRGMLGADRIVTRPPGYMMVVEPGELDADRFESLVADAQRAPTPDKAIALLEQGEREWRGAALVEFAASGWAKPMAERLQRARTDAAGDRAEARLRAGRPQDAARELEGLVEQSPYDERLWRLLILAHYRCGRQADALETYKRARVTLVGELGVDPSPELRDLEGQVLRQDPSLDGPQPEISSPTPPASWGTGGPSRAESAPRTSGSDLSWVPPSLAGLVGRDAAVDRLVATIATVQSDGRGQLALVGGEPGAGKTRLLAELARRADERGCLVLYGPCDEEPSGPYQPVVNALRPALGAAADLDLGPLAADLSVLFPELAAEGAEPSSIPTLDQESRRHRLFEAIDRALGELARHHTVVLLLDDLHWADRAVLMLLRHVARTLATRRIVLVAAFRTDAAEPGNALQSSLLHLRRHLPAVDVAVDRLTDRDIAELLREWIGDDRDAERTLLAQRLGRETAGNALFVTEIVRDMFAGGPGSPPRADGLDGGQLPLPGTVADMVAFRVVRLEEATQRFLTAAAVVGAAFDVAVAAEVAGLDDDAAMDAVDEAVGRGIVVEASAGRMAFSHALFRRALYARLAAPRRVRMHLAVARALERRDPDLVDVEGLARHFGAGAALGARAGPGAGAGVGPDAEAVRAARRYARLAGDRAVDQLSYETAIDHYRRALDLLPPGSSGPEASERCEVLLALAGALNQGADTQEAKESLLEAADIAVARREPSQLARAALAFGGQIEVGGDITDPRSVALLHRAINALPPGDTAERAQLLGRLAQAEYWVQPRAGRVARCEEALAIARRVDDPRTLAEVLVSRHWALNGPDDVELRLRSSAEVEQIAAELGDPELALEAGKCRLHLLLDLGAWDEALEAAERQRRRAGEVRQPEYERLALSFDAVLAGNEGRFDDAERLAQRAREVLLQRGKRIHAGVVHSLQVLPWLWLQSRLDEQAGRLRLAVEREPERPTWRALLAWAHAEGGDPAKAADQLERLDLARYLSADRNLDFWLVAVAGAIASSHIGDERSAALLYDALCPYADRNAFVGQIAFLGCIEHHLGALALALGRGDAAGHLRRAVDRYGAMDATAYRERAAELLVAAG